MSDSLSDLANTEEGATTPTPTPDAPTQGDQADNQAPSSAPTLSALADDPNDTSWIPEKYAVKNEAGELDPIATLRKTEEGRANLEKRLGTGDVPPKDASEYSVDLGDVPKEAVDAFVGDAGMQEVLKQAHELGFTNKQVNFMVKGLVTMAGNPEEIAQTQVANTISSLKQEWNNLADYKANFAAADKALEVYGKGLDAQAVLKSPEMVKILSNIGKSMGEGKVPDANPIDPKTFEEQVVAIRASKAYNEADHPEHNQAMSKMEALYNEMFKKQLVA